MTQSTSADPLARFTDKEMAYHEAGHAVIHAKHGGTINRISIVRTDSRRGVHISPLPAPEPLDEAAARRTIQTLMGGEVAHYLLRDEKKEVPDSLDRERALQSARKVTASDSAANTLVAEGWDEALALLREPAAWARVQALAAALIERRTLEGAEITQILTGAR
jgi:ATP-dependent Zn protease